MIGFFYFLIFGTFAYSFFLGAVWIKNDIYNHTYERDYSGGDVLTCFFGVLTGMISFGMTSPNIKAVVDGQVAGKMAFDIIERKS